MRRVDGKRWRRLDVRRDIGDETIASPWDIDHEALAVSAISEDPTQGGDMNREVARRNIRVRPDKGHQLFLANQFARPIHQRNQDIQSTAADVNRLVALLEQALIRQQSERTKALCVLNIPLESEISQQPQAVGSTGWSFRVQHLLLSFRTGLIRSRQ